MTNTINQLHNTPKITPNTSGQTQPKVNGSQNFADAFNQAKLQFSNHAQKRLESRNINLAEDGIARLALAVDKAEQRGGQESLILMDDLAFIVNVQDRKVVTAVDTKNQGEGVFTRIDTVVLADQKA